MLAGVALAGIVLAGESALGADYPVLRGSQAVEDAPPAPDYSGGTFNWSGFYFGGFAGQTQTRFRTDRGVFDLANGAYNATTALSEFTPAALVQTNSRDDRGKTFGGFTGYNMAFGDAVIGAEAEYSRIDQETAKSTFEARRLGSGDVYVASVQNARLNDYINARLRFGYAYGRLMPYFTIGAAAGRFDTNVSVSADWRAPANNYANSYVGYPRTLGGPKKDVWGYGWSIGGGLEAALTENIILRGEYLYTTFNNVEGVTVNVNTARVGAAVKF
jgi:opacity protein-like surface antigen